MLIHLIFEQTVDQADSLVRVNLGQGISKIEDFLLKQIKLVPVMRVLISAAKTLLKHEVSLDDPSESVPHLRCHKC